MKNNGIYVGIDGGGTSTRLVAVENDRVIFESSGGSSNLCSNSREIVRQNLARLFSGCPMPITAVCIGSAGVVAKENKIALKEIIGEITSCEKILVTDDAAIALEAGLEGEQGISITAGTGSICYGKNSLGEYKRAGGWGHIFADHGSAYYIAALGLEKAMKTYDNGENSVLLDQLINKAGVKNAEEMVEKIYTELSAKTDIAAFAKAVDSAAALGDKDAQHILNQSGVMLAELCKTVHRRLNIGDGSFKIVCNGSVLTKNQGVRRAFEKEFAGYNCKIIDSANPPAMGAVILAQGIN